MATKGNNRGEAGSDSRPAALTQTSEIEEGFDTSDPRYQLDAISTTCVALVMKYSTTLSFEIHTERLEELKNELKECERYKHHLELCHFADAITLIKVNGEPLPILDLEDASIHPSKWLFVVYGQERRL